MKRMVLVVLAAFVILLAFSACAGPVSEIGPVSKLVSGEIELKYDDGILGGRQGIGGSGWGAIVEFTPPSAFFNVSKIRIDGEIVGSDYKGRKFDVFIWDNNQKELYKQSFSHSSFENLTCVEITVSGVIVSDNFYVVVVPNTPKEAGVYLHYSRDENKRSGVVKRWKIVDWYIKPTEETTNWMIRVIGTVHQP